MCLRIVFARISALNSGGSFVDTPKSDKLFKKNYAAAPCIVFF